MKMIWESRKEIQQPGAPHMRVVAWDFLKMLAAAVLCGLAVSITAAGITLLLTGSAEARLFQKEFTTTAQTNEFDVANSDALVPTPGALLLGDGCDGTFLNAIERDWQVRIDGERVEVRVMQAFQLPAESAEVATFHVQLIDGARMLSIAAQSSAKEWAGQVINAEEYDHLSPEEYLTLSRNKILASSSPRGTVVTSPLMGLNAGELITVEYKYVIALDSADGISAFVLPLETEEPFADSHYNMGDNDTSPSTGWQATKGAVWVEWVGRKPLRVTGLPADADVEMSTSRIEGFSWATHAIQPGAHFQFAWTM